MRVVDNFVKKLIAFFPNLQCVMIQQNGRYDDQEEIDCKTLYYTLGERSAVEEGLSWEGHDLAYLDGEVNEEVFDNKIWPKIETMAIKVTAMSVIQTKIPKKNKWVFWLGDDPNGVTIYT